MGLEILIDNDIDKIKQQIFALEWQLKQENNEKDRQIFLDSLASLREALKRLESASND